MTEHLIGVEDWRTGPYDHAHRGYCQCGWNGQWQAMKGSAETDAYNHLADVRDAAQTNAELEEPR